MCIPGGCRPPKGTLSFPKWGLGSEYHKKKHLLHNIKTCYGHACRWQSCRNRAHELYEAFYLAGRPPNCVKMASVTYDWYWLTSVLGETATLNLRVLCPLVSRLRNCCFIICLVVKRLIYTAPRTEGRTKLVNNPAKEDDHISPARSSLWTGDESVEGSENHWHSALSQDKELPYQGTFLSIAYH